MGVFPKYQYRGAGTLLTKWGTDLADNINAIVSHSPSSCATWSEAENRLQCVLEGSTAARWMYENVGFVVQEHFALTVSETFGTRPIDRLFFMVRPRPVVA